MKASELRELIDDELRKRCSDWEEELFRLRVQLLIGQLENPHRIKLVRRNIARVKTILREREKGKR